MVKNDIMMGSIPTGTWPYPQNVKRRYLKFRLVTYVTPLRGRLKKGNFVEFCFAAFVDENITLHNS